MKVLAIDLGSYSIKFYEASLDRKKISYLHKHEIILDKIRQEVNLEEDTLQTQLELIYNYLGKKEYDGKIILNLPNNFVSTRFISIPITNRKKAEAMIPFQLDENIPYSLSKTHYTKNIRKVGKSTLATVYITNKDNFNQYFEMLEQEKVMPWILSSEMASYESFIQRNAITGQNCILDLGHKTSKAYLFIGNNFVSNHFTSVAGKLVDEAISQNYQISMDEAIIYKHENCFMLTEPQYDQVEKEQQEFAFLMKQTFWPLVLKIKQWMIGFKAITGKPVERIFITGGTSKIKNIDNFLSFYLSVDVIPLKTYGKENEMKFGIEEENKIAYSLPYLMLDAQANKPALPNFLVGVYSSEPQDRISMYNMAFLATRTTILFLVIALTFFLERFTIAKEEKRLDKKLISMLKTPALNINATQRRAYKRNPGAILKLIQKRNLQTEKDINNLKAATKIDPIKALANISQIVDPNMEIDLVSYEYDNHVSKIQFRGKKAKKVKELYKDLKVLGLEEENIKFNLAKKEINLRINTKED
ncbi:MAG: hypothetical protein DRQ88_03350 [Epsilonproteobacteria bacterium]|nr:MAG: hypothetical protein DRQ89_01410 [Campylobacterota bacterium]RLA67355.1 MAG: hypothetical protein DRQ88_03350 [Campylobacterota bacterium]